MNAPALPELLAEVERRGGRLFLDGENIRFRAPEPLPDELVDRLRQHKPEIRRRLLADQAERRQQEKISAAPATSATPATFRPFQPQESQESQPVRPENIPTSDRGRSLVADPETPCPTCNGGSLWRDQTGAWWCERCNPPGTEPVRTWRNFSGGKTPPGPPPTEAWPADLNALLRRVSTAFEWSDADRRDFIAWARRSKDGMAEASRFLEAECAKLPAPGLIDRLADAQHAKARGPV